MFISDNPSQGEIMKVLSLAPIFTGIGLIEQRLLADKCHITHYLPGDIVIEQGDIGDKIYIIIHGTVEVSIKHQSLGWKRINILRDGDVFGEIAILRNIPRTARITTVTACQFLTVSSHDFLQVYQYFPDQARNNIQLIVAKRLQQVGAHSYM